MTQTKVRGAQIVPASTSVSGSMSAADKTKLDLLTLAAATSITGGGTLALGGFTLTVPATGTAALLASVNAFTNANSITLTGAGIGANSSALLITHNISDTESLIPRSVAVVATFSNTGTTGVDFRAMNFQAFATGTGTGVAFYGVFGISSANQTSGSIFAATGGSFSARNIGAATVASGYASQATILVSGAGGMTTAYHYFAGAPTFSSTGASVDLFGYYASNQGNAKVTNSYAFYAAAQSGSTTLNYTWYSNAGLIHFGDTVDLASGKNITLLAGNITTDTTTGTKIGTATNQKFAFFNATPVIQRASADQAAAPAGGTGATAGAYDTAAHRDAMITLVNEMRLAIIAFGIIKGSA